MNATSGFVGRAGRPTLPRTTVYVSAVVLTGTVVVAQSVYKVLAEPPGAGWIVLTLLTVATGFATLRMPVIPISFSISDTFTLAAALLFGPEAGALAVAADALVISSRLKNRMLERLLFNATAPALAMWVAAHVFFWISGVGPLVGQPGRIATLVWPLGVFATLYFVLNTGLVARAVASEQDQPFVSTWRRHFLGLWLTFFGGASIAALVMVVFDRRVLDPRLVVLALPLMTVLYLMFRGVVNRMEDEFAHLARVNQLYHSLIDGAAYGIARVGLDGRFMHVNPALSAMLGYASPNELLGRNLWTEVAVEGESLEALFAGNTDEERRVERECTWRRDDGTRVLVRVSVRLVPDGSAVKPGLEMIVEDVTARRALEQELQQAQRLDAIGHISGSVAHDYQNLLMVVIGSGELALQQIEPEHPASVEIKAMLRAAGTASSLTRQLLAFGRGRPWQPTAVNVSDVVTELTDLLRRLMGPGIALEYDLERQLPPVLIDRGQLQQVVLNLAVNARDAMPGGGTLTVATVSGRPADAGAGPRPPHLVYLRVRDTGQGIGSEVLPHIFEPFFTTKEAGKGNGLGLATVSRIVRQSGGTVQVDSVPSGGSTFTVVLPVADGGVSRISGGRA